MDALLFAIPKPQNSMPLIFNNSSLLVITLY